MYRFVLEGLKEDNIYVEAKPLPRLLYSMRIYIGRLPFDDYRIYPYTQGVRLHQPDLSTRYIPTHM
jgi:hypothetical protein